MVNFKVLIDYRNIFLDWIYSCLNLQNNIDKKDTVAA